MISIEGNAITLTRGDSLTLEIGLTKDGETYTPSDGDTIRFAISKKYRGEYGYKLMLSKVVPNDTLLLRLPSSDTGKLPNGTYNYDVEITYQDGNVDTFISSTLTIVGEVE